MMDVSRRSFLGGALALTAAASLPLKAFASVPVIHGDGFHDDSAGLQAAIDGKPFRCVGERVAVRNAGGAIYISGGSYLLSRTLLIREETTVLDGHFQASGELTGPVLRMRGGTMIGCAVFGGPRSSFGIYAEDPAIFAGGFNGGYIEHSVVDA